MGNTESETDWVQSLRGSRKQSGAKPQGLEIRCWVRWKPLLASKFPIKAGQADCEGLERAEREPVIHGEDVRGHTAKLQHDVLGYGSRRKGW